MRPRGGPACDAGAARVSVTDRGGSSPIDHVALSKGQPDGLYVAGKRLLPSLTFDEWRRYRDLTDARRRRGLAPGDAAEFAALHERVTRATVVITWRIEGGHPGAPEEQTTTDGSAEGKQRWAYAWGANDSTGRLSHALIEWALGEMRRTHDSTNDYYGAVSKVVDRLADEWMFPIASICQIVARTDLAAAKKQLGAAKAVAKKWGVA